MNNGKGHNKKRNSALLYEFLVRVISTSLIEGDKKRSSSALKLIKKHFKPGTELYKEFRLINSLMKTTVSSEHVASSILQEAKVAARSHDFSKLDKEKSLLIRNINHRFVDHSVYDQHVNEYRMYATIQTLLNDWRNRNSDLERVAKYEEQLINWLMTEKVQSDGGDLMEESPGTSRLLMNVMTQKLNEKYSSSLSAEQKQLLKSYAFSVGNGNYEALKETLFEINEKLINEIDSYISENPKDYVCNQLNEVKEKLQVESFDEINDSTISDAMLYMKLINELNSGDSDV